MYSAYIYCEMGKLRLHCFLGVLSATAVAFVAPTSSSAQSCDPANMMLVVDQSSSMQTGRIGGETKWSIAVDAIDQVVEEHESSLQIGLMKFPAVGQCSPGVVNVNPALNTRSAIAAQLQGAPPSAGNWTPMAQTLRALASTPSMIPSDETRYAVLVTDGWQWCDEANYDQATRFEPVNAVTELRSQGIVTYIVGFGASVDTLTLNQAAVAAGTARPGCNPNSTTSANSCYYQADSPSQLVNSLNFIAEDVSEEICDGLNNDCDNEVDEGISGSCTTACGEGSLVCSNGETRCEGAEPEEEDCDRRGDEDCDGDVDEGCGCTPGETTFCGPRDSCQFGSQTCNDDGRWGECEGVRLPSRETCDDIDNDCDGNVDEVQSYSDTPTPLCPVGRVCLDGNCVSPPPAVPPGDDDPDPIPPLIPDNGDFVVSGGGCHTIKGQTTGAFILLLGLLALAFRRRV